MTTNFDFLHKIDKNLYTIISEAELLYRDEYFEQCMVQTRRFGEHICKKILGKRINNERTFDEMLATLKDKTTGEVQEKELIDDLYFLKKHGNSSAHSIQVHKDGIEALECLQRAFEVSINYCTYITGTGKRFLKLQYDTELLVTGEKSKKSLATKYKEEKIKNSNQNISKKTQNNTKKEKIKQSYNMVSKNINKNNKSFWIFILISLLISAFLLLFMTII